MRFFFFVRVSTRRALSFKSCHGNDVECWGHVSRCSSCRRSVCRCSGSPGEIRGSRLSHSAVRQQLEAGLIVSRWYRQVTSQAAAVGVGWVGQLLTLTERIKFHTGPQVDERMDVTVRAISGCAPPDMSCMRMPRTERDTNELQASHETGEVSTVSGEPLRDVADRVQLQGEPPSPDQRHNNIKPTKHMRRSLGRSCKDLWKHVMLAPRNFPQTQTFSCRVTGSGCSTTTTHVTARQRRNGMHTTVHA